MKETQLYIAGNQFSVQPTLHEGIYSVSSQGQTALIGKDEKGEWELTLQETGAIAFPAAAIGEALEAILASEDGA